MAWRSFEDEREDLDPSSGYRCAGWCLTFPSMIQLCCLTTSYQRSMFPLRGPPWRQHRGQLMIYFVNSHANATRIGWHLLEIDSGFAPRLPPGWHGRAESGDSNPYSNANAFVFLMNRLFTSLSWKQCCWERSWDTTGVNTKAFCLPDSRETFLLTTYWSESTL